MKELFFELKLARILLFSLAIFAGFFLISLSKPQKAEAAAAQVAGFVFDQNGNALNNAVVTLRVGRVIAPQVCGYSMQNGSFTYTTGSNGAYKFGADDFSNGICCNASSFSVSATYFLAGSGSINLSLNPNGSTTWQNITINVPPPPQPPTAYITANGTHGSITVTTGTTVTIGWLSNNATSCFVSPPNWTGTGGSMTVTATTTTTYTEACVNSINQSAQDSVTVIVSGVSPPPPPVNPPPPPVGPPPPPPSPPVGLGTPTLSLVSGLPPTCISTGSTYGSALSFNWSSVIGATNYEIQVSVWPGFVNSGGGSEYANKILSDTSTTGSGGWIPNGVSPVDAFGNLKLNPATTYYWRVRASRGAETGNWSSTSSFSAKVCANDFTIAFKNPPGNTVTTSAGDPSGAVFLIEANALAGFNGKITLSENLVSNNPTKGFSITFVPNKFPLGSPFSNTALVTFTVNTSLATSQGDYNFTVTGTSPGYTDKNINGTLRVVLGAPPAWIQTTKGDVGSLREIKLTTPCTDPCPANFLLADKLVLSKNVSLSLSSFRIAKSWLVKSYSGPLSVSPSKYDDFKGKFASNINSIRQQNNYLPGGNGVSLIRDDVDWDGTFIGGTRCLQNKKEARVVFIAGDLTITRDTARTTCPLVIIVSGSVTVKPEVSRINAMILADGSFITNATNSTLTVNGGVMAGLKPSVGDKFNLNRDLETGNIALPAEKFVYEPKYLWYLTDYLGVAKNHFSEAKP